VEDDGRWRGAYPGSVAVISAGNDGVYASCADSVLDQTNGLLNRRINREQAFASAWFRACIVRPTGRIDFPRHPRSEFRARNPSIIQPEKAHVPVMEIFVQTVQGWRDLGAVGLLALAVAFAVGAMVFAPRPPMCVISGLVFGFVAVPIALLASTLGSVLAFLLSRYLFRSRFLKLIERRPLWRALVEAIDAEGWRLVGLLRLASLIPGSATSYLLGVTRIGLWPYSAATLVGLLPQIFLFVYIGAAGQIALEDAARSPLRVTLVVVGLAFTAWAVFVVTRRTRQSLHNIRSLTAAAERG